MLQSYLNFSPSQKKYESSPQTSQLLDKESNLISQTPITGAFVQFSEDWEDPREAEVVATFGE